MKSTTKKIRVLVTNMPGQTWRKIKAKAEADGITMPDAGVARWALTQFLLLSTQIAPCPSC
ncbi:MAG: hypothetical protein KAV00_11985, partial [Phycisphaerae bacterium]|nr:hypothetical protein [Phycisphaerae bacterium]